MRFQNHSLTPIHLWRAKNVRNFLHVYVSCLANSDGPRACLSFSRVPNFVYFMSLFGFCSRWAFLAASPRAMYRKLTACLWTMNSFASSALSFWDCLYRALLVLPEMWSILLIVLLRISLYICSIHVVSQLGDKIRLYPIQAGFQFAASCND